MAAATNPDNSMIMETYTKRLDEVLRKLATKVGQDVHSFEVKEIMGEYDFVSKKLYQMKDVTALMLEMARGYQTDVKLQEATDKI